MHLQVAPSRARKLGMLAGVCLASAATLTLIAMSFIFSYDPQLVVNKNLTTFYALERPFHFLSFSFCRAGPHKKSESMTHAVRRCTATEDSSAPHAFCW